MGSYVTQADLVARYGEQDLVRLTDRTNSPPSTIDSDVVTAAIGDAESFAQTYIRARYTLPLAEVPAALTRQVAAIAWWNLKGPGRATEDDRQAYEDAMRWLEKVGDGKAVLVESDGDQVAGGKADVRIAGPDRVITSETLEGY